ncbi:hypothetical protein Lesp02_31910 [Lentzea sp. NBRC 105346]|uniref:lantibiotic dehydratase C-terminal domain-containing protein n=1 Tax=Lentzea sp. NBRC 105346 TaxID=3032205 RepID=UPI0024A28EB5|nr:lantibiotic dehydratase C-terminal domain-containing protein [Lentzea sp. NBRC 105346]GLZ31002.1 hypothetical protein Lesp02_31910 [Lentzea sp. NBRC 105346]
MNPDRLLADFHATTAGLAADLRGPNAAFTVMIATAHGLSGLDVLRGAVSFRSHAEAVLHTARPEVRASWDAHYARHAGALTTRVEAVVAGREPLAHRWIELLLPLRQRAHRLVATGELSLPDIDENASWSPFHLAMFANERWQRTVRPSVRFAVFRVMLNYTYLFLERIGVTEAQRFQLCHLAANAVEEVYGVSALELVSR